MNLVNLRGQRPNDSGFDYSNQSSSAVAGRVAIAAIIGGTASVISGGKFKNGATTAAMAQLLNAETENKRKLTEQSLADNKETLDRVLAARMRNDTTDSRKMLLKLTPNIIFGVRDRMFEVW